MILTEKMVLELTNQKKRKAVLEALQELRKKLLEKETIV